MSQNSTSQEKVRRGVPEIVLAEGKSDDDLVGICSKMIERTGNVIVSRLDDSQISRLDEKFRDGYETRTVPTCQINRDQNKELSQIEDGR